MEVTLKQSPVEGYACPLETVICQEETQEAIVPDACPDILRVLCTDARCRLTRKECQEGKVECAGTVQVTVLYLPDGEEGPRRLELAIPFRTAAAGGAEPSWQAVASARVTAAETRVLNPRKVLCRVELAVSCQGWARREETLCRPPEEGPVALERRCRELESYTAMAVAEKAFAFTDDVTLPAGCPAAAELLGHRLELRCAEAKIVGSKLILKGEAALSCRYRTGENTLALGRWDLPFSQIVETDGAEEEGSCAVDVVERESQVTLAPDGEGRTLSVHLELLAQAVVRQTRPVTLFTDAYSITHDLTVERRPWVLDQLWEDSAVNQLCREVLETGQPVDRVEDCWVDLGVCAVTREEQEGVLSVRGRACVVYTDESGALNALERPVTLTARIALPAGGTCRCRCALAGEVQALAAAGGVELRCPVRFSYLTTLPRTLETVTAIQAEEAQEPERRPSVRLRLAQPGEELWDIAKTCRATQADILRANDLPEDDIPAGKLLLIPSSR